jgi:hypothetical protein
VLYLLQQNPVIIDVSQPPPAAARDISIDVIISIFALAGMFLLAAAVGSLLVGGVIVFLKRRREKDAPSGHDQEPSHIRLQI